MSQKKLGFGLMRLPKDDNGVILLDQVQERITMNRFGFGAMRLPLINPDDKQSIDMDELKRMVDIYMEAGFTYFDTAWMYCGFASENAAKEALVSRYPRDAYTLATKLHSGFIKTKEDRDHIFNEQLSKTGVEYFDYYL